MGVFKNGKDISAGTSLSGVDEAVRAAIDKAGDSLLEKLSKAMGSFQVRPGSVPIEDDDEESMRELSKIASSRVKVEGSNFSQLGKNEAVTPGININDAIGAIGEVE